MELEENSTKTYKTYYGILSNTENSVLILNTPFIFHSFNNDLDIHEYFSEEELKKYYDNQVDLNNKTKFDNKNIVIIILESFSKEYVVL